MRQRRSRLHTFIYHVYIIICKRQRRSSESCDNAEACPTPSPLPCQSPTLLTCYTRRFVSAYIIVITTAIFVCHTTSSSVRSFFTACLAAFVLSCDDLATRCCLASVVQDQLPCSSHFSCSFFFTVPLLLFDHSLLLYVTLPDVSPTNCHTCAIGWLPWRSLHSHTSF